MTTQASRREFLRQASALSIAGTAAPFALEPRVDRRRVGASRRWLQGTGLRVPVRRATMAHNTVVPFDAANYAKYSVGRRHLAWDQPTELTPTDADHAAAWRTCSFRLPTPLAPLATLFDQQKCAIVANVGPLIMPTTRTSFQTPRLSAAAETVFA